MVEVIAQAAAEGLASLLTYDEIKEGKPLKRRRLLMFVCMAVLAVISLSMLFIVFKG
jgi:hypothetical protein